MSLGGTSYVTTVPGILPVNMLSAMPADAGIQKLEKGAKSWANKNDLKIAWYWLLDSFFVLPGNKSWSAYVLLFIRVVELY